MSVTGYLNMGNSSGVEEKVLLGLPEVVRMP